MPSRMLSDSGVTSVPSFVTSTTFIPPSSSRYLPSTESRNSTCAQPCSYASACGSRLEA